MKKVYEVKDNGTTKFFSSAIKAASHIYVRIVVATADKNHYIPEIYGHEFSESIIKDQILHPRKRHFIVVVYNKKTGNAVRNLECSIRGVL